MVESIGGHGSLIGATLGGYEVEALIGRGAMGSVYLARDLKLNRRVALKVLLGSLARTPSLVRQFHLEAQAAAPLRHACIVRVYSAGIEDGTPYIAMEFVDGEPLDRFLKRVGKVTWQVGLHVGGQLAQALDCAHRHGIVHRDIKPSNIMLDRKGGVRLTDFGIARVRSEEGAASKRQQVIGTPQYMSPEQVTGQEVSPASDLFSLGVTLYQMISGEMPFRGQSSIGLIKSICTDDPIRLNKLDPGVPDDVARLVAYLLEKEPSSRPSSAKVVCGLIERLQRQRGGESAISASLTAFLKEEMEARPFSHLGRLSRASHSKRSSAPGRARTSKRRLRWRRAVEISMVTILALLAFSIGPVMGSRAREDRAGRAPLMDLSGFTALGPGVTRAHILIEGYQLDRVHWVGDEPVLLVEARGQPGALSAGAVGLLAVYPEREEVRSLQAPFGAASDPASARARGSMAFSIAVPRMPAGAPLAGTILVQATVPGPRPIAMLAQRWDAAAPEPTVLYRATREAWYGQEDPQWPSIEFGRVAVNPDGRTICMLLFDEETGQSYLVERDVREKPLYRVGPRRMSGGGVIVPGSIQYSPDGSKIGYLRRSVGRDSELWLLVSGDTETTAHRLARGIVGDVFSFSPDGSRIAARVRNADSGVAEVALLDARSGEVETTFGSGLLSSQAWHPSGHYLIFLSEGEHSGETQRGTGSVLQLFAGQTRTPYGVTQLSRGRNGLAGRYAVSGEGRWIAAVRSETNIPGIVLLDWEQLRL